MMELDLDYGCIVHCFTCPHSVYGANPDEAHARMEVHYAAKHAALIASFVGARFPRRENPK